jgi:hypothetical protein
MASLEKSAQRLAGALDALEARIADRQGDLAAKSDEIDAARVRSRTAKVQAAAAAEDLADAIRDLKRLIGPAQGD